MTSLIDFAINIDPNVYAQIPSLLRGITSIGGELIYKTRNAGKSIADLNTELASLKAFREIYVNYKDIREANAEIAKMERKVVTLSTMKKVPVLEKLLYGGKGMVKEAKAPGGGLMGFAKRAAKKIPGVLKATAKLGKKGLEAAKDKGLESFRDNYKEHKDRAARLLTETNEARFMKGIPDKERYATPADNVAGKVSNIQKTVEATAEQFVTALMPIADKVLTAFQPIVDKLPAIVGMLVPHFEKLGEVFAGLMPGISTLVDVLMQAIQPVLEFATSDAMKSFAGALIDFSISIGKLLIPVLNILKPVAEFLVKIITGILRFVGWIVDKITSMITWLINHWPSWLGGKKGEKFVSPVPNVDEFLAQTKLAIAETKDDKKKAKATGHTDKSHLGQAASRTGSHINGGGQRQVILNLNAPLVKEQIFKVASMAEAVQVSLREQEEMLVRILAGAAASIA